MRNGHEVRSLFFSFSVPFVNDSKDEDIESEDSDSEDSNPYAPASSSNRQLTARQAVLASAVDPSHVTLESSTTGKKSQFTASEVALRKEENARKRKNMIEKKLEDEKAETINRLLKKQSRPKKRNTAQVQSDMEDMDPDGEDDTTETPAAPTLPMYRWVSTSRGHDSMSISFSVPESFLPPEGNEKVDAIQLSAVTPPSRCAVPGCDNARKYRAVGRPWGIGACGVGHLRVLQGNA
ncbi:PAPA-1-like conserved region-domain-containing protein [Mycena haematopus]|nr:PAPA-1-like conserved region-domain-containing protein [Mycena haematopus]